MVSKEQARKCIRQYLPVSDCVGLRCDLSQVAGVDSICSRRPLLQGICTRTNIRGTITSKGSTESPSFKLQIKKLAPA